MNEALESSDPALRRVRLPEHFSVSGAVEGDDHGGDERFPWRIAVDYVTDGRRFGALTGCASIRWLSESQQVQIDLFREEFADLSIADLLAGIRAYTRRHPRLKFLWKEDLAALEDLQAEREEELVD